MIPREELEQRMRRFRVRLDKDVPNWQVVFLTQKVSLYYLTGTMASGALWIPRDNEATLFVRKGYERARAESAFSHIEYMKSYRDMAQKITLIPSTVHIEKKAMYMADMELINRYFLFTEIHSADSSLMFVQSVKTDYEVERLQKGGAIHALVLDDIGPRTLLKEGISEANLGMQLMSAMVANGAHGLLRANMADTDVFGGYIGFSESTLLPTNFDGPDGVRGLHASAPHLGSPHRLLEKGDLIMVDMACSFEGYHTDKTSIYLFQGKIPPHVNDIHNQCVTLQLEIAEKLLPGAIPSQIYEEAIQSLSPSFLKDFMGPGGQTVNFLGHGIGLHLDEFPVIAKNFNEPLQENMMIALEPKKAIPGVGMVGTENTFVVTPKGGVSLTGNQNNIIVCE